MRKKWIMLLMCAITVMTPVRAYADDIVTPEAPTATSAPTTTPEPKERVNEALIPSDGELLATEWRDTTLRKLLKTSLSEGAYRYEIFYSAKNTPPVVAAISPDGIVHEQNGADGIVVTRENAPLADYEDLRYTVFYVRVQTAGDWILSFTATDKVDFLCVVRTETPDKWQAIRKETLSYPESLILWRIEEGTTYKVEDFPQITRQRDNGGKFQTAPTPTPAPVVEEEEKQTGINPDLYIFGIGAIGIAAFVGYSMIAKKKKEKRREVKKQKQIAEAKEELQRRRDTENQELEIMMESFSGEYIDYPEEHNYYEESILSSKQKQDEPFIKTTQEPEREIVVEKQSNEQIKKSPFLRDTTLGTEETDDVINFF